MRGALLLVALPFLCAIGCTRAPARRPLAVTTPAPRAALESCPDGVPGVLPAAVGGFRIGRESSFGRAGLSCTHAGYAWSELDDGGTCSETPVRVVFPAAARLVRCESRVCSVQLRYEFGGDTALRDATRRLWSELTERYGEGEWRPDEAMPCPRVEGDEFGCILDGVGIAQVEWRVADPADGADACAAPSAVIALRAQGDRGTHDAHVTVTYLTRDAVALYRESGL